MIKRDIYLLSLARTLVWYRDLLYGRGPFHGLPLRRLMRHVGLNQSAFPRRSLSICMSEDPKLLQWCVLGSNVRGRRLLTLDRPSASLALTYCWTNPRASCLVLRTGIPACDLYCAYIPSRDNIITFAEREFSEFTHLIAPCISSDFYHG